VRCLGVGGGPNLEAACALVRVGGGDVERVATGAEALERLARPPTPDLIVVEDPGGDAAALVRRVREHARGEAAAVLALAPDLAAARAALEAGAALALPGAPGDDVLAAAIDAAARTRAAGAVEPGAGLLFERNPNPLWFYDVDTLRFLGVNDAAVEKYGFSRDEFLSMTLEDIRPAEDRLRLREATARLPAAPARSFGWRHRTKGGRVFPVEIISSPAVYRGRACELILPHDVSDREAALRREEELLAQLAAQDRMASIGALAAAVAHEVNTPLTYVLANVAYLEARLGEAPARGLPAAPEQAADAVGEVASGLRRIQALMRDLRTLSLGEEADRGPCDAANAVRSAAAIAAGEIRARAALALDLPDGLPPAAASEARLGQVMLNLLTNAAHSIPHGAASDNVIRVSARAEGGRIALEVADTGTGIAPDVLPRIFEPFFTTKRAGEGTGLGLWIVRRVLGPLGGEVVALPHAPRGTVMRVTLPAAAPAAAHAPSPEAALPTAPAHAPSPEAAPPTARAPAPSPPSSASRPRLLVVDDEPLVGRAIQRLLRDVADAEVEPSGRAALARFARGERFDLVLCDVMMPELPAPELHARLSAIDPAAAAGLVFMTGGAFTPREQAFLASVPNRCLEKPLDLAELRALLRARRS